MNHVTWLRTSYRVGAVADAVAAVSLIIPGRTGEIEFRYAMGVAAALMLSWTALLIWGDRRPVERRGILLLTAFPLIPCLLAAAIYAGVVGQLTPGEAAFRSIVLVLIFGLMLYSYVKAERAVSRES
jgi:hypothetical protein